MARPAGRMKTGAEHRVPLSDEVLEVLERVRPLRDDAGRAAVPVAGAVGQAALQHDVDEAVARLRARGPYDRTRPQVVVSRLVRRPRQAPRELAEAALAHTVGGVEGSYFRSDLFERRRTAHGSVGGARDRPEAREGRIIPQ